jgi:GTP cyclohydrolase I
MKLPALADVQAELDERGVALDRVGITGFHYPLRIRQKQGGTQTVTAAIDLAVGLHQEQRGAHLSHLVEALDTYRDRLFSMDDVVRLVREVRNGQDTRGLEFDQAHLSIRFKYFLPKVAPSSGLEALVPYDCGFEVALNGPGYKSVVVRVPVTSVCPCSLEISEIGAHNQRAEVTVQLWQEHEDDRFIWFEDAIELAERCGSSAVHSLLKRPDEKAVTERMFRTPRFVEDIVREAVVLIRREIGGVRYVVRCESFESIHPHNAYAETSGVC